MPWILSTGVWNDAGIWDDADVWNDGAVTAMNTDLGTNPPIYGTQFIPVPVTALQIGYQFL